MALNFEDLVKESERRSQSAGINNQPYLYTASDGTEVSIPFPKADVFMALSELDDNQIASQFRILLSRNPKGLAALNRDLAKLDVSALSLLQESMWDFWNTDVNSVPGKSKG